MGHSISGIYALYYANRYGEELEGVIGIDTSVPSMDQNIPKEMQTAEDMIPYIVRFKQKTGMLRLSLWLQRGNQGGNGELNCLSDSESKMRKWYMMCRWLNKTMMNEVKNTPNNMEKSSDLKFPGRIPVLFLLAERNTERIPGWEELHRNIIEERFFSHVEVFDGDHYLYHSKGKEIAEIASKWVEKVKKERKRGEHDYTASGEDDDWR